jgi:hypothetical protein
MIGWETENLIGRGRMDITGCCQCLGLHSNKLFVYTLSFLLAFLLFDYRKNHSNFKIHRNYKVDFCSKLLHTCADNFLTLKNFLSLKTKDLSNQSCTVFLLLSPFSTSFRYLFL